MSLIKGQCRVMVVVIMTNSVTLVTDKWSNLLLGAMGRDGL